MKVVNFMKKKMKLLRKELQESHENAKICYICNGKFENKYLKDIIKLEIIFIMQGNIVVLRLAYVI